MPAELVGRSTEVRGIGLLLKQAQAGQSRWIQASGEPGIGKTRLLSHVATWQRSAGSWCSTV
jgi:predicted ATPase